MLPFSYRSTGLRPQRLATVLGCVSNRKIFCERELQEKCLLLEYSVWEQPNSKSYSCDPQTLESTGSQEFDALGFYCLYTVSVVVQTDFPDKITGNLRSLPVAISFETAQPYNPAISYGTGQREQGQQEFQNYLTAQQQAFQQYHQQAQLDQNADQFDQSLAQRQDEADNSNKQFEARQQPSERDKWQAAEEMKQMQARGQLQQLMKEQDVTAAEKREVERANNAIAEVNTHPGLDDAQKADAIIQIRTNGKVDAVKQRLEAAQEKMQQQKIKEMQDAAAEDAKNIVARKNIVAAHGIGGVIPYPNGIGIVQPDGKIDYHAHPKTEKPEHERALTPQDYKTFMDAATKMADSQFDEQKKALEGANSGGKMMPPTDEQKQAQIQSNFQQLVNHWRASARTTAMQPPMADPRQYMPLPPQAAPPAVPVAAPAPPVAAAAAPPAPVPPPMLGTEKSKWTPTQVELDSKFTKAKAGFDPKVPVEKVALEATDKAHQLILRYGSVEAMPDYTRKVYYDALDIASNVATAKAARK